MRRHTNNDHKKPDGLSRNSLVSKTKRESLLGRESRRNSHCSIIEVADSVVLVEMNPDETDNKHTRIPNYTHHDSLDLLTNIRQMEETQQRIEDTLQNIARVRNQNTEQSSNDIQEDKDGNLVHSSKQLLSAPERGTFIVNSTSESNKTIDYGTVNESYSRNSDAPDSNQTAMTNKIHGLLKAALRVKNRKSEGNMSLKKNIDVIDNKLEKRNNKSLHTEEFVSEKEFSEKNLKKRSMQLHIFKELLTSEQSYVNSLELLCKDFRHFMIQSTNSVQNPVLHFNNLSEILNLSKYLLKEFDIRIRTWNYSHKVSDIFVKNGDRMSVYTAYLKNFTAMISEFDQHCRNYPEFEKLVTLFERSPKCKNLKIEHFLLKPVQRLPQYKLLLAEYLKQLEEESEDHTDTEEAIKIISDVLRQANDAI